jgi:hypothetical protein
MPPTDPLLYRFYELVMVNGPALKALIEEEFGDGIMSAIDSLSSSTAFLMRRETACGSSCPANSCPKNITAPNRACRNTDLRRSDRGYRRSRAFAARPLIRRFAPPSPASGRRESRALRGAPSGAAVAPALFTVGGRQSDRASPAARQREALRTADWRLHIVVTPSNFSLNAHIEEA